MAILNHPSYHKFNPHSNYNAQRVFKQSYDNSCGATCLLYALLELGITQIPTIPKRISAKYTFLEGGAPRLLALNSICESILYQITRDNPNRHDTENWGYSMPSNIILCAQMLGLKAYVSMKETWSILLLRVRYSEELTKT